jgi:transposase-like protein
MDVPNPKTLQEAIQIFSEYENCRRFMAFLRWPDGNVTCPRCGSGNVGYLERARLYVCYAGTHRRQKFSLKVGTVFEDSPIPLEKWLPAFWMLANDKNGISSWELHRALGVTQKTAWFMLHRIRVALKSGGFGQRYKFGGVNAGPVEVDETFVGPQKRFMHKNRQLRYEQEGGIKSKVVVQGLLDRDLRQVRVNILPNVKRETLQNAIFAQVKHGSKIYTDTATQYDSGLQRRFVHEMVNKVESYVNGQVHVNGIENFWSLFKRTLRGTYVAVEPFHLGRYADEQVFRFNNRATKDNPLDDSDRFMYALSKIVGKRLTYSELTGKTDEAARPETF